LAMLGVTSVAEISDEVLVNSNGKS